MQVYHQKTLTIGDGTATSVVRPSDWNSTHLVDIVLSGHTAGSSVVSGSQIVFNGGNNLTISGDTANSQIIFSVGAGADGGVGIADVNAHTISSGTIVFSNSNSVSFGLNGSTMTASIPAFQSQGAYLTTAMQSNASTNFAGLGNTTAVTGNLSMSVAVGTAGIAISMNNGAAGLSTGVTGGGGASAGITVNTAGVAISVFDLPILRFAPYDLLPSLSASTSAGQNTLQLVPFVLPTPMSFGQINMILSAPAVTQTAANSLSFSIANGSSMGLTVQASISMSRFLDYYLFSRGTGVFSTNLFTFASTENLMATQQSMTFQVSATDAAGNSTASFSVLSSFSQVMSFPGLTSGTQTSINPASSATTWGVSLMTLSGSTTASISNTGNTTSTFSSQLVGAVPSTTMFSSYQMIPIAFGTSLTPGEYWLGSIQRSSTSSNSAQTTAGFAAGNSISFTVNNSTMTANAGIGLNVMGMTSSIVGSLGWLGSGTKATMAPMPGQGTFSTTFTGNSTYVNNMGQANGVIALSAINTNVSFWIPWMEFASNRA